MIDLLMLIILVAAFVILALFVRLCERVVGPDHSDLHECEELTAEVTSGSKTTA